MANIIAFGEAIKFTNKKTGSLNAPYKKNKHKNNNNGK